MPLHDYGCASCGYYLSDQYRSVIEGASACPPYCPSCPGEILMQWIPQVGAMDTYDVNLCFDVKDGRNQLIHVDSLKKLRMVERESEAMAANGEGQKMVWRKYSQDRSNVHKHSIMEDPSEAPTRASARRFSPIRHGEKQPDRAFGPQVGEHNATALKG